VHHKVAMKENETIVDLAAFTRRAKGISEWLRRNAPECFEEQKHLDKGSQEKIYWHYGYMAALSDVLWYLTGERPSSPERDTQRPDICN
jgi:hypothetical protein